MGIGYGWVAPILWNLENTPSEIVVTTEQSSWIASLHSFGRAIGPFWSVLLIDTIGRKAVLIIYALFSFLQWLLIVFSKSVYSIYLVRIIFGMTLGMYEVACTVYIGENCTPKLRGILGSVAVAFFYGGLFIEYVLATYLSYSTVAIVNLSIAFVCLASIFLLKETTQFLIMKGETAKAEENLMWLKGITDSSAIKAEFDRITQNVYAEKMKKFSFKDIFMSPANYKSMTIVLIIYLLAALTGYEAITAYASILFASSNVFTENEFTILFGFLQFVAVTASSFIIERVTRRTFILSAFSLCTLMLLCTTILYYLQKRVLSLPYFPWLIFFTITSYTTIYAASYPAVYVIRGELFPLSVKALGGCLSITANSITGFLTTKVFSLISESYGIYVNFFLFTVFSVVVIIYVYLVLPETKGKKLLEIQEALECRECAR